jgi:hypothetical protein
MTSGQNFDRKYRDGTRGKYDCMRAGVFFRDRVRMILWLGGTSIENNPVCELKTASKGAVYLMARNDSDTQIDVEYSLICQNSALNFTDVTIDVERKGILYTVPRYDKGKEATESQPVHHRFNVVAGQQAFLGQEVLHAKIDDKDKPTDDGHLQITVSVI